MGYKQGIGVASNSLFLCNQGECLHVFRAHENWVRGVCIHPTGKYVLSCSDDKSIRVIEVKDGRVIRTIADAHEHFVTAISMPIDYVHSSKTSKSPKYHVVLTGSVDKTLSVWPCS